MVKRSQVLTNILNKMEAERAEKLAFMERNILTEILDNRKNAFDAAKSDNPNASAIISSAAEQEKELFALAKKQSEEREQTYREIAILDDEIIEINNQIFCSTRNEE